MQGPHKTILTYFYGEVDATTADMCERLAKATGDRVATVDVVLWRACAIGLLLVNNGHVILLETDC